MFFNHKIIQEIKAFVESTQNDFESGLSNTKVFAQNNFKALYPETNPILVHKDTMTSQQLGFVITEYAAFSQEAIHMLVDAMLRNHDWPDLFKELQENIDEEKGSETKGVPHLEIMREGYRSDLGLEVDSRKIKTSFVTRDFLDSMRYIFNNDDNAHSAGGLLAFEGSAIAEFHIVDKIIKTFLDKSESKTSSRLHNTLTKYYIDGHKEFEIGHEAHLIKAIKPYIDSSNITSMVRGYVAVAHTMDIWWEQLYLESINFEAKNYLYDFDEEYYSVKRDILG